MRVLLLVAPLLAALYTFNRSVNAGADMLKAFPDTPIAMAVKGRTKAEEDSEYIGNTEVLAKLLRKTQRRDLIVTSFRQQAVDRFHVLAPEIGTAPGIDGAAAFLLGGGSPRATRGTRGSATPRMRP